ncbi:hypothetical protein C8N40_102394 [Pontibacter mucosus]|uniref:Uncharacterized protein n=1 Tax=Pontibacter mucosus TaxID=1649266 RepID=A0A2T5YQ19_9BACT|nr:hypothetical protein C8N40_102394 [Pontibacter mucosus]
MLKGLQQLLQAFCMWVFGRFILKTAWSDWLVSLKYNASFKYLKFCSSGSNHPYPSLAKEGSL